MKFIIIFLCARVPGETLRIEELPLSWVSDPVSALPGSKSSLVLHVHPNVQKAGVISYNSMSSCIRFITFFLISLHQNLFIYLFFWKGAYTFLQHLSFLPFEKGHWQDLLLHGTLGYVTTAWIWAMSMCGLLDAFPSPTVLFLTPFISDIKKHWSRKRLDILYKCI